MHTIEPHYAWLDHYSATEDPRSPLFEAENSLDSYVNTIYGYYIHPQWDSLDSDTLFLKILFVDYDLGLAIIEFIGEWNDAIENDIMWLKREVVDVMEKEGISKFILVTENVLNFHSSDREYYQEWYDDVSDENGWIVSLNMPEATKEDFKKKKLNYYIELMELPDWRVYKPYHLFKKIDDILMKRLG